MDTAITSNEKNTESKKDVFKKGMKKFVDTATGKVANSIGDMIVTMLVSSISIAYMFNTINASLLDRVIGLYIAGMIVQLLIRIVHRFDESYTNDEIAERVIEFEASINEKLDSIKNQL